MKQLLFVRHAKSSWSQPGLADIERPLNDRGNRDAPFMIKFLVDQGISPDRLISSPAVRAYTTANYFRKGLQLDKESLVKESDLYFGGESDWLDIINSMSDDINCPAFFSHNPTITYFSNQFSDDPFENIPTCGVVHLQSTADKWSALHFDNTKVINHFFPKEIK